MAVVVDASALVELLARSDGARVVEEAVLRTPAFAPELIDVEVLSAINGLERSRKVSASGARRALEALLGAPITRVPHAGLLRDAWARRRNLSAYDAMYVSLAARLGCPLITGDRRLARASGLGVPVTLLPTADR